MSPDADRFEQAASALAAVGRRFDARGWVLGTSGNFSVVVERSPLRLAITRSGVHKGALDQAGAVMHTHSIWATFLSDRCGDEGGVAIEGYEMLKGLAGVRTHEHREWIPILENDQDMARLAGQVRRTLTEHPGCHGFLLRRHGLYTWGATPDEAVRHVEIFEFLLESVGRARYSAAIREEAVPWRS